MKQGRLTAPWQSIIDYFIGARVDYFGFYEATVVSQSADLSTVDVQPSSSRFRGNTFPIYFGMPGVSAHVKQGTKVLFGFIGGSPAKPYIAAWLGPDPVLLKLNSGTHHAARVGDTATVPVDSAWVNWFVTVGGVVGTPPPGTPPGTGLSVTIDSNDATVKIG